jgi:hypothetical protein
MSTLVCPNAGGLGRADWHVGSAPKTSVYMQALALVRALGGARAHSYCHIA